MKTNIITVCSRQPRPNESYYRPDLFLKSIRRFGCEPFILGEKDEWRGLMTKPLLYRAFLSTCLNERSMEYMDTVMLTDCWDIIFAAHPDEIAERKINLYGNAVVFNGEKNCWPREDLKEFFPDQGTPWRYLNSGFICGPAKKVLEILDAMNIEQIGFDRTESGRKIEPNDQGEFQRMFVEHPVQMAVDAKCHLAQAFSNCEQSEFTLDKFGVVNKVTGTRPGVLHGNGPAKSWLPAIAKAMSL